MSPLVIGIGLVALILIWNTRFRTPVLLASAGMLVLWMVLTGKLHALFALVAALFPFAQRVWQVIRLWPTVRRFMGNKAAPKTSEVTTDSLKMVLDLSSGQISGEILAGPHAGKALSDLTQAELHEQIQWSDANDSQAGALLRQYLGNSADDSGESVSAPEVGSLSRDQAAEILGISASASAKEVRDAHRNLISKLHPDKGGNDYLASLLNAAKERLLR